MLSTAGPRDIFFLELGRMLKFGFEYSFYIFYETLWFVSADKTKKYSKCIWLVLAEPRTIFGGSNSSACSPKALICWQ